MNDFYLKLFLGISLCIIQILTVRRFKDVNDLIKQKMKYSMVFSFCSIVLIFFERGYEFWASLSAAVMFLLWFILLSKQTS
tara:strand:+ start:314 stop:556 length:243 start_codon:yes stop_codon:yes gene_type:complete